MPSGFDSFLCGRANAETKMAARASDVSAVWSHSQLARLYILRCIEADGDRTSCISCVMGSECLRLTVERPATFAWSSYVL